MKVSVNGKEIIELSEIQKKVICNDINADIMDADFERRIKYILKHKYERCMERLKQQWMPKLKKNGVTEVPLDNDSFAQLVFAQPNYKDRKARDLEEAQGK